MTAERPIRTISFVDTSRDDPESVTVALYDDDGHFRLRFSREQTRQLGLQCLSAATRKADGEEVAIPVVAFEIGAFPDGGAAVKFDTRGGPIHLALPPEAAKELHRALTQTIEQAVSLHPGGSGRAH